MTKYRHVKRGSEYTIVGHALVQVSIGGPITEGVIVTIYKNDEGMMFARRKSEFEDGRFVAIEEGK